MYSNKHNFLFAFFWGRMFVNITHPKGWKGRETERDRGSEKEIKEAIIK